MDRQKQNLRVLAAASARRFAGWDDAAFLHLCTKRHSPAQRLLQELEGAPNAEAVWRAYVTLCVELIGGGHCEGSVLRWLSGRYAKPEHASSFLAYAVAALLPRWLPKLAPKAQLGLMAAAWNAGEGLLSSKGWLDRYVLRHADEFESPHAFRETLTRLLTPVLDASASAAPWRGPYAVSTLDVGAFCQDFLPGTLRLADARVLSLEDRLSPGRYVGILLLPGGQSEVLGWLEEPGDASSARTWLRFDNDLLHLGDHSVRLPWIGEKHDHIICESGFIVSTSIDSQKLWIVEEVAA